MEIFNEIMSTYLIPAIITALGGIVAYIGTKIKNVYETKVQDQQIRTIVDNVVAFVERTAKSEENQIKYNTALEKAEEWLATKGFTVDSTELALLIESSVNKLDKTNKED